MAKHFRQIAILSLREFKRNFLIVIIFSFLMLFLIKRKYSNENEIQSIDDEEMPVILWWHAMADGTNQIKNCSNRFCRITTDRNYLTVAKVGLYGLYKIYGVFFILIPCFRPSYSMVLILMCLICHCHDYLTICGLYCMKSLHVIYNSCRIIVGCNISIIPRLSVVTVICH